MSATSSVDSSFISAPFVVQVGTGFMMWYTCDNPSLPHYAICAATSPDGVSWTKKPSPVLTASSAGWDHGDLYSPSVIYDGSMYGMWYTGVTTVGNVQQTQIGHATSKDGVTWTKDPNNPILRPGAPGSDWDAMGPSNQFAIPYKNGFLLYYDSSTDPTGLEYIGVASS